MVGSTVCFFFAQLIWCVGFVLMSVSNKTAISRRGPGLAGTGHKQQEFESSGLLLPLES